MCEWKIYVLTKGWKMKKKKKLQTGWKKKKTMFPKGWNIKVPQTIQSASAASSGGRAAAGTGGDKGSCGAWID